MPRLFAPANVSASSLLAVALLLTSAAGSGTALPCPLPSGLRSAPAEERACCQGESVSCCHHALTSIQTPTEASQRAGGRSLSRDGHAAAIATRPAFLGIVPLPPLQAASELSRSPPIAVLLVTRTLLI